MANATIEEAKKDLANIEVQLSALSTLTDDPDLLISDAGEQLLERQDVLLSSKAAVLKYISKLIEEGGQR